MKRFAQWLKIHREVSGLTIHDAAKKLNMGVGRYEDIEVERDNVGYAERYGMLVLLGMSHSEALHVIQPRLEFINSAELCAIPFDEAPLAREENGEIIMSDRFSDTEYTFEKRELRTKGRILEWLLHLTEKRWVTGRHINQLLMLIGTPRIHG